MTNLHLGVYSASPAINLTNTDLAAINDGILTRLNNHLIVPTQADILWVYGGGVGLSRARINTPKFRLIGLPSVVPVNNALIPPSPPNIYDGRIFPLRVNPVDEVAIEVTTDGTAGAAQFVGLQFAFAKQAIQPGPIYRLRASAAITAAAGTWVNGTMTMDQTLPSGRYAVVGLDVVGANLMFARLIFPGSSFRPGCLCRDVNSSFKANLFEPGEQGVLGEFDSINLPNLEICSHGANTAQQVYLDLQYLSPQTGGL